MAKGLVLFLTGVLVLGGERVAASQRTRVRLDPDKCCEPATRTPPAGQCETDCLPNVFCDPAPVIGTWKNGGCKAKPKKNCGKTVTNRPQPAFQCTPIPCVDAHGMPGVKCYWALTGDTGPVQMAVNSCVGDLC